MENLKNTDKENDKQNTFTWNPWSGCTKISEGCRNCYNRTKPIKVDGDYILCRFNKTYFYIPTQRIRKFDDNLMKNVNTYKIPSGSTIKVCDSSDFFLAEADYYRKRAWKQILERKDCLFDITTKRPERFFINLPETWTSDGWHNVIINVSVENQMRANERVPKLLDLPVRYRGIEVAPLQDRVDLRKYLSTGLIDRVVVSGESYTKSSENIIVCNFEFVEDIREQCEAYDVSFRFNSTGNKLYKDKKVININSSDQSNLADFYNIGNKENSLSINWENNLQEVENLERIEQAAEIFAKLNKQGGYRDGWSK